MALAIPQQWSGSGGRSDVRVAGSPAEGSWLVATVAYRVTDGGEPLGVVADVGRNWWLLCGSAFNADSATRVEVWACPKIMFAGFPLAEVYSAVAHIHADDTGSHVVHVAEVTGFANGYPTLLGAVAGTATGTSLSIALPDPGADALIIAAAAADNNAVAVTAPGAPWTALTPVERDGPDLSLTPVWQAGSGTQTATWTSASSLIWTGVVIALAETGTVWEQPNTNWPATRLEIAAGYGQDVPLPRIPAGDWVDQTDRFEQLAGASRGIGYELGRPQAGTSVLTLRNYDDGITLTAGGEYDMYTPYRLLAAWDGKIYPAAAGWLEQAVRTWRTPHHGYVDWSTVDALATLVQDVPTALRGEILRHDPFAYWPLDDPSESATARNVAARSSMQLLVKQSKYGVADATQSFGGALDIPGDAGGTGWQQQGLVAADTRRGFALVGSEVGGFPPISGGITIVGLSRYDIDFTDGTGQPNTELTICLLRSQDARNNTVLKLSAEPRFTEPDAFTTSVSVWDKDTAARSDHAGELQIVGQGALVPWAIRFNRTGFRHDLQAVDDIFAVTGSCDLPAGFESILIGGEADQWYQGNCGNGTHAHIALFDRWLSDGEVGAIMFDAARGWPQEATRARAQRYFAVSGSAAPRALDGSYTTCGQDGTTGVLLQQAADLADGDAGLLYGDAAGYVRLRTSLRSYHQQPRWVLGGDTAAGEIPVDPGSVRVTVDPTYLYTRVTVANTGEESRASVHVNTTFVDRSHLADASQGSRYGTRPLDRSANLYDAAQAQTLAEWLLAQYREPLPRFAELTVNAHTYPQAWPLVLGVEVGDLLTVVHRPVGQDAITARCRVLQVKPVITSGIGKTAGAVTLTLAAAPPQVLVLGDPDAGRLGAATIGY